MPSRAERRRQSRGEKPGISARLGALAGREVIAAAVLGVAVLVAAGGFLLLSDGGEDGGAPPAATGGAAFSPGTEDEAAIEALARRSIEVLPRGQWPALYDDFTPEFQERCPREEFVQAGITAAQEQEEDLQKLGYVRLEDVIVTGDSASATIVGEIKGELEYRVMAAFQKVEGAWKLSPAPDTAGCQAFGRL